jgi:chaperone modulatory protein CbpM
MTITLVEFIKRANIDRSTLEVWIEEEWVLPQGQSDALVFSEADLARARLIQNLMVDMGINSEGVGVALHLIDQIHDLRRALAELAERSRN